MEARFQDLVDALTAEMARWRSALAERTVSTVFIGGGTPTVLTEEQLAQLFAALHANFRLAADCEITCEANPGTVDQAKFAALRRLGANRLSMGVQSFQPHELAFLGRIHDTTDVYRAYDAARAVGFENINLDFIFGLPHQEPGSWEDTLARALALGPEHLSLYSLIVEPDTPLQHWVQMGKVDEPDDDLAADLYETAMAKLAAAGYVQYEVSNWARGAAAQNSRTQDDRAQSAAADDVKDDCSPGAVTPAYACRHNLIYWRNDDYLGVGPGAHSHLRQATKVGISAATVNSSQNSTPSVAQNGDQNGSAGERRWGNRKPVGGYIKRIRQGESVEEFSEEIDAPLAMGETMMLGLRLLREGVPYGRFAARHGLAVQEAFGPELHKLRAQALLTWDEDRVRLTPEGLLLGNRVFAEFLPN
jgi:oxygen-independent coproporphyrinogen-3 oxidase